MADLESARARDIIKAGAYTALVAPKQTPSLARELLAGVTPGELLTAAVQSSPDASSMLAGLWLWHDALDESHAISQSLQTPTGSFWHAIMHRREGDFSNSKYWYARCRNHPALAQIAVRAAPLLAKLTDRAVARRLGGGGWDTDAFVDWVEEVSGRADAPDLALAIQLQQTEWHTLFEHCAREAAGR